MTLVHSQPHPISLAFSIDFKVTGSQVTVLTHFSLLFPTRPSIFICLDVLVIPFHSLYLFTLLHYEHQAKYFLSLDSVQYVTHNGP